MDRLICSVYVHDVLVLRQTKLLIENFPGHLLNNLCMVFVLKKTVGIQFSAHNAFLSFRNETRAVYFHNVIAKQTVLVIKCINIDIIYSMYVLRREETANFQWDSCWSMFNFLCCVLQIIVCHFSFGHCVACPSFYGSCLHLLHLHTLLAHLALLVLS